MAHLKVLMVAMVIAAVWIGGGGTTASAAELCSTSTTNCSGTKYNSGTVMHAQLEAGTLATLPTSTTTVTCPESTVEGTTTSSGGTNVTITGTITGLIFFGHCVTSGGTTCEVKTINLPYSASISGGGTSAGAKSTLTVTDPAGAGAYVKCGFLIDCTFTTTSATLNMTNQASGTPTAAANVTLNRSGFICPSTATWEAAYTITKPDPLFIV